MRIQTQGLGSIEASPDSFLTLPEGMIGYESAREFALVSPVDFAPFRWLLSFEDPSLSFPLLEPARVVPGYAPTIAAADRRTIGAREPDPLAIYLVASLSTERRALTVNLRAPLVVHPARRLAKQVVLADSRLEVEHRVLDLDLASEAIASERIRPERIARARS